MDALILAGGLGTRLASVVSDRAKSVALAAGEPFLVHVISHLAKSGLVGRVILCVGHLADSVEEALGSHCAGLPLCYSREPEPLGTGGALRLALASFKSKAPVLALNGDTILPLNLAGLVGHHDQHQSDLTLALSYAKDAARFGTVLVEHERISGFREKSGAASGWINGGVYLLGGAARQQLLAMPPRFSLEQDFFPARLTSLRCVGYRSRAKFLDIGVPEDYLRVAAVLRRGK